MQRNSIIMIVWSPLWLVFVKGQPIKKQSTVLLLHPALACPPKFDS